MNGTQIRQVRAFTRFYTNVIGLLNQHILDSPFSLPEARVLFELKRLQPCTASEVMTVLNTDRGYMSRIIKLFEKRGLVTRTKSRKDGRAYFLTLTPKGEKSFKKIDAASHEQVVRLLRSLPTAARRKLLTHMNSIREILSHQQQPST